MSENYGEYDPNGKLLEEVLNRPGVAETVIVSLASAFKELDVENSGSKAAQIVEELQSPEE